MFLAALPSPDLSHFVLGERQYPLKSGREPVETISRSPNAFANDIHFAMEKSLIPGRSIETEAWFCRTLRLQTGPVEDRLT